MLNRTNFFVVALALLLNTLVDSSPFDGMDMLRVVLTAGVLLVLRGVLEHLVEDTRQATLDEVERVATNELDLRHASSREPRSALPQAHRRSCRHRTPPDADAPVPVPRSRSRRRW